MSSSEARTLKATPRKLRKAREKGQVPVQRDTRLFVTTFAALGYLWVMLPAFVALFEESMAAAVAGLAEPEGGVARQIAAGLSGAGRLVGGLAAVILATAVIATLVLNRGLVLSVEPLKPKLSNLDPVSGLKRIFGVRAVVELAKSLVRLVAAGAAIFVVLYQAAPSILNAAGCGMACLADLTLSLLAIEAAVFFAIGAAFAAADLPLQVWLFDRTQKMSVSEMKREQKDVYGSLEVKRELNRLRRDAARSTARGGLRHATLVVFGQNHAVGLRFDKRETRVPVVVARASGDGVARFLDGVRLHALPHYRDETLARRLHATARPGAAVPREEFAHVARVLMALNLL
ncbi:MAG: EscU/YscU/HrcU family type III secretion system export apparatus switch protein [Rhodobacteraceae bacterium]|jgi:type III secretion protein U|nr:EscU/YscU/HrcU family type III secretion system export apparatus switch protein [Paracoccaceae bacterium]